jgi:hypothetical protein
MIRRRQLESNELVVGRSSTGESMNKKGRRIYVVRSRYQVTIIEDYNRLRLSMCCSYLYNVYVNDGVIINCSYEL